MMSTNRWILTLIQGVLAVGVGAWMLLGRSSALTVFGYAVALYIAVAGLIQTARALLNWGAANSTIELLRGLLGLLSGVLVLILAYFTNTAPPTLLTILAISLIAYGAVGLFSHVFARGERHFAWQTLLVNALLVLLGILVFVDRTQEIDILLWAAIIFILAGAVMIVYSLTRQRGHAEETASI